MVMLSVLNNPVLTLQLGKLLGLMGRIVKGRVREVSLAQVSCILMYVYVAPPTPVGAWSMALGLRQRFIIMSGDSIYCEQELHNQTNECSKKAALAWYFQTLLVKPVFALAIHCARLP